VTIHLIKMAVGVDDLDHLIELRRARRKREGDGPVCHRTRHMPRRAAEILDDGSLYWVIKGLIRVRQRIVALTAEADEEGRKCCAIAMDHALVPTEPKLQRPFQGWRYFALEDAPPDRRGAGAGDELPAKLVRELRSLGLL
jgi:hypothetical protein